MMRLTALTLLATGVMASNTTNDTTAPATSTAAPATMEVCTIPSQATIAGLAAANVTYPSLIHAGDIETTCCSAVRDSWLAGLSAGAPNSMLNNLPLGADGAPVDAGMCWSDGGCVNTTAKNYYPKDPEYLNQRRHICKNPDCVSAGLMGLLTVATGLQNATGPFNMAILGASNYATFCDERLRGDLNTLIADNTTSASDVTLYNTMLGEIDANIVAIKAKIADYCTATGSVVGQCAPPPATSTAAPVANTTAAAAAVTVTGSLTVGFTVPENTTVAALAADATFKSALAASIKASLTDLPTSATVTITSIAAAARRSLMAKLQRRLAALDLKVDYEISGVTEAQANAVYTEIANNGETFAAAVKTASVAEFTTAGLTGYAVDTVVAAAPTMVGATPAAATPVVLDDEASSSAFSVAATGAIAMATVASLF